MDLCSKDEDGQVIFNQYSFCELVKHLLVELVGISYEEASQIVERSPLAAPVDNVMGVAIFSHETDLLLGYVFLLWERLLVGGTRVFQRSQRIMDAYFALEKQIMEKTPLKRAF